MFSSINMQAIYSRGRAYLQPGYGADYPRCIKQGMSAPTYYRLAGKFFASDSHLVGAAIGNNTFRRHPTVVGYLPKAQKLAG